MRFDVHWRKVRMFLMDFRWTREWNLTRLKERKKNRKVSLQQGKIDWGKKRKKVTQEDKQKGKVIHGMNIYESVFRVLEKMLENSQRWQWWSEKGLQSDGLLSTCGYWGTTETINRREGKSPCKNQQNAKISAMMMMIMSCVWEAKMTTMIVTISGWEKAGQWTWRVARE